MLELCSYVAEKFVNDDVTWLPKGKSLGIIDTQEEGQQAQQERMLGKIK